MQKSTSTNFEHSLRKEVTRLGKGSFEDAIREVVNHHQDLVDEALNGGATVDEARMYADNTIGNVSEIAKGIRTGNSKQRGIKLQWIAMAIFVFGAFLPRFMEYNGYEVGSLWGNLVHASYAIGLITIYAAGFLAALGIFRAKKVVIPAFCLGLLLIPLGHSGFIIYSVRSFRNFDLGHQAYATHWQQYAVKYRPILHERYDLYEASISGNQQESEEAIKKLSASVLRPQDRGAIFNEETKGKWIYPIAIQKIRDDNLNWVYFATTDSFELAQKEWRSSDQLLKAIPTIRKGSEAEFALASSKPNISATLNIRLQSLANFLPFFASFLLSLLMIGIVNNVKKLTGRRRQAL